MKLHLPLRSLLWLVLGCLMIAVPLSMIARKEYIISQGETFRFRLAPVDPVDPFRGRFMTLNFEVERKMHTIPSDEGDPATPLTCFALIENDPQGYAQIGNISLQEPYGGYYLKLSILRNHSGRLRLPFNRYYMNETLAPLVEKQARDLIQEATRTGQPSPVYALVRIHGGEGVITSLSGPKGPLTGGSGN